MKPILTSARVLRGLACGLSFAIAGSAAAADAPANLVKSAVDAARTLRLAGHVVHWARAQADRGAVAASLRMDGLGLTLKRSPERQRAFDDLLRAQQDPASADYQHWLTPSEIGERFGASASDIDAVTSWLQSQGLDVDGVANNRLQIRFSGAAADVARAFSTDLRYYAVGGETRVASTSEPAIPAAFADAVASVRGLSTLRTRPAHRMQRAQSAAVGGVPQPASTNCPGSGPCSHIVFPADFATIYDVAASHQQGLDGRGQTIAIPSRMRISTADMSNFQDQAELPASTIVTTVPPSGIDPGAPLTSCTGSCDDHSDAASDQLEATLDVQRASSVAPGATINLIASKATTTGDGIYIATEYAIDALSPRPQILSLSYTTCEADNDAAAASELDGLFAQAAMEGISVFVASGDGGVAGCAALDSAPTPNEQKSANLLCASGNVTCVGGTSFADSANPSAYWNTDNGPGYGSARGYIPEGAWNEPLDDSGATQVSASGGGVSVYIAKPSWQVGTGVPGGAGRYTPDIAFGASLKDGYFTCMAANGGSCVVSNGQIGFLAGAGTSASTPSAAGIAALLNQKTGAAQGNLNPRLYALAANPANGIFHDINAATAGVSPCTTATPSACNNTTPGPNGLAGGLTGYVVGSGYDLVTGLGSIDVGQLLAQFGGSAAASINLNQFGLEGSFANETAARQGLLLTVLPDFVAPGTGALYGSWTTFDTSASGGQRWYTLQGNVQAGAASATMPIYTVPTGVFGAHFTVDAETVGTATLHFSDCDHGTLDFTFTDGSGRVGTMPLNRLLPNLTCTPQGTTALPSSSYLLSGIWDIDEASAQGLNFDVNPQLGGFFATWVSYTNGTRSGNAHDQRWYSLQGAYTPGSRVYDVGIYTAQNGVFNGPSATVTAGAVGSARITFSSCSQATLDYTFDSTPLAMAGQGTFHLTRLGPVPAGCTF